MAGEPLKSLEEVVEEIDLNFLRNVAALEEEESIKGLSSSKGENIFHIAVSLNKAEFIEEAMKILPAPVLQSLLCQGDEDKNRNPLHVAAYKDYNKIVKLILDYYRSFNEISCIQKKPWLGLDRDLQTPFHCAIEGCHQRAALEILSMDPVLLSNVEDRRGYSPLFLAVKKGYSLVALQILESSPKCSFGGKDGTNALLYAPNCSENVFKLMFERAPHLIVGQDINKVTVLHKWVLLSKLYPFEYILSSNNIDSGLRRGFIDQLSTTDFLENNPLHIIVAINNDSLCVKIVQLLVNAYIKEREQSAESQPPWLVKNRYGCTPLDGAIKAGREQLALYLFSLDPVKFLLGSDKLLFFAIVVRKCPKVAEKMLHTVQQNAGLHLLTLDDNGRNALHYAPLCSESFLRQLLETHPEFVTSRDDEEFSILHNWIRIGELWPFKFMIERDDIDPQCRSSFIQLLWYFDSKGRTPLHIAPTSKLQTHMVDIVQLLLKASYNKSIFDKLWSQKDFLGYTPLGLAVEERQEELALLYLSMDKTLSEVEEDLLLKAANKECHQVVKFLLKWTIQHNDKKFLKSDAHNILHVMQNSTEEDWAFIVENFPELINEKDEDGKTALDRCSEAGTSKLVELILKKDRSSILKAPDAWIEACNNSHLSTILAFIDNSPYFRHICRARRDTPFHHLKGLTYTEYERFLQHQLMSEFINFRNSDGKTPLHMAIENKDKDFVEVLLGMSEVDRSIKDNNGRRAMDLLIVECQQSDEWRKMCEIIGVDPYLKTSYIRSKTDLKEMRSTISVVAALLATITFTVGFTMPGGLNNTNGEAVLGKKAVFWAFLLSDSYSMACSMLVLFCIIWSMVCERDESALLIDRSLVLLKQSLYGTSLAFMTGVYGVIPHKSLWGAISVIIITSLVVVLASRSILYNVIKLIPAAEEEDNQWLHFFNRRRKKKASSEETAADQELARLNLRDQSEAELHSLV